VKRFKWAVGVLLLAIVPVLAVTHVVGAQRFTDSVDKDQTVNSSVYSTGKTVDIAGTINGDVYCMGQTVTINANVRGDVICAGQDVTVNGTVDGNIRLAGQSVSVGAVVSRSATIAGMTVSIDAEARIGSDLTITGDTLNIKGEVMRDAVVAGNATIFNGIIGRDVRASGAQVRLKDKANIAGNFNYTSANEVKKDKGAKVKGDTVRTQPSKKDNNGIINRYSLSFYLFMVFGLGLITIALALTFPRFLRRSSDRINNELTKTLITGIVASFVVPMVSVGLVLTVVGIPLVFFLLIAWLFGALLSGPVAAFYVGRLILRRRQNALAIAALGSVVLVTAYYLPIVGILVLMLAYWLGFGAMLLGLREFMGAAGDDTEPKDQKPKVKLAKEKTSKKK
jgi:hypothetical protein